MIILIFGKSGSGKTYLAEELRNKLDNSIHIDIDTLNTDLYTTPNVINYARSIFGDDIIAGKKINKSAIYDAISSNSELYNKWVEYMIESCQKFLDAYISSTSFDYYIIDHINSHLFDFGDNNNIIKILCTEDEDTRYARLIKRDKISPDTMKFRDYHYIDSTANITYRGNNTDEIMAYIKAKK